MVDGSHGGPTYPSFCWPRPLASVVSSQQIESLYSLLINIQYHVIAKFTSDTDLVWKQNPAGVKFRKKIALTLTFILQT